MDVPEQSLDEIAKSFFTHAVAAADLLNSLAPQTAGQVGLGPCYLPGHITSMLGQEFLSSHGGGKRIVDLLFRIVEPDSLRTLAVVHVEVQEETPEDMNSRMGEYQYRLWDHLEDAGIVDDTDRAVPTLQLLVHTGSGRWPEAHRPVTYAAAAGGYLTSEPIAMLDVGGQHRDDAWSALRPQTETAAFTCLTLLQRDVAKLSRRGRDMIPAYALHMQQLFRQLYNLSCSRDWEAHGLDATVSRWITGTIMSHVANEKYFFTPNLRNAKSLEEIVMEQDTLVAEMEAGWDQVQAKGEEIGEARGQARGQAIQHRLVLLELAAPHLTESALSRCSAALEQMDLAALPTVTEVARVSSRGGDGARPLERLLTLGRSDTGEGGF